MRSFIILIAGRADIKVTLITADVFLLEFTAVVTDKLGFVTIFDTLQGVSSHILRLLDIVDAPNANHKFAPLSWTR